MVIFFIITGREALLSRTNSPDDAPREVSNHKQRPINERQMNFYFRTRKFPIVVIRIISEIPIIGCPLTKLWLLLS